MSVSCSHVNSRLFKSIGLAASLLALFFMLGGHWFALQSVAWTRMLAAFAKTDSLSEAIQKTFDGEHPCKMCLGIREARQQEEQALPLVKTVKLPELFLECRRIEVPRPPVHGEAVVGFVPQPHADFMDSPPNPPPRSFLAVL